MGLIFQNDFSSGWRPSDDAIGGNKNCLLRMQNVKLDEIGALTLVPGSLKITPSELTNFAHTIYSKTLNGSLFRFACTSTGEMLVDTSFNGSYSTDVKLAAGSTSKAAFGSAYNYVLMCSGTQKLKYDPVVNASGATPIGPKAPTIAPTVALHAAYTVDLTGTIASYTLLSGGTSAITTSSGFVKLTPDSATLNGVANFIYGSPVDSTSLSSGSKMTPGDLFSLDFQADDPTQIQDVTVIFKDNADIKNYFEFTFNAGNSTANVGPNTTGKLQCKRGDFDILGKPDWSTIKQIVVAVTTYDGVTAFYFNNIQFSGGTLGSLNGSIEYCQVNLQNRNNTSVRGPRSAITTVVCNQQSSTITPQDPIFGDIYNNGWEIYRRGGGLDAFYLVKSGGATFAAFDDTVDDSTALLDGVIFNELTSRIYDISDDILGIVGPYNNRTLYFTSKNIYISFDGNPECYSSGTGVITPYGTSGEFFLWAEKFGNNAILVGTTNDIYEITGTLSELPDGTIDAFVRPTATKNPPIADAHASSTNELYYIANDGIRAVNPSGNFPLGDQLDLLFKGNTRYGYYPPKIHAGNADKHILVVSKNELYWSFIDTNGGGLRKMIAYDISKKYYYEYKCDDGGYGAPVSLFVEEDGKLTASFSDSGNKLIRVLNTGTKIDGSTNLTIDLRTKIFNGDLPRQRKDSFTLKFKIDTGNAGLAINLYKDESSSPVSLGSIAASGLTEVFIDLSASIGICKSYQLEISGTCPSFKLVDFSIDFEPRPVPLSYIRSTPTNYGIQGRKRIYEIPITIDTLGSVVSMVPYLDGVAQTGLNINTTTKTTVSYLFNPPTAAKDIFYTLVEIGGNQFEFYGDVQPRAIEPLPDSTASFVIPNSNFGSHARKRFIAFAFVIDTNGQNCSFTPTVDGVNFAPITVNTINKRTFIYYFTSRVEGIDIGGTIVGVSGSTFEYYGVNLEECVSEKLPASATYLVIPNTNLGTYARKRLIAFAFSINTRGNVVNFTPVIDSVSFPVFQVLTFDRTTFIYYFPSRTEGIDIGGILFSPTTSAFEYYGAVLEECVSEKLPPSCTNLNLPVNNFGVAGRKRIRTIPLVIDTKGSSITYTPSVDGVNYPTASFTTFSKATVLYYFDSDAFGIDIGGTLNGINNFEFYTMLNPEIVETLPVAKHFDQLGPVEFNRNANIKAFRSRIVATGNTITYTLYVNDVQRDTGIINTSANIDKVYEIPWVAKYLNGTTARIELKSSSPFHRFSSEIRINITGSATQGKWIKL